MERGNGHSVAANETIEALYRRHAPKAT